MGRKRKSADPVSGDPGEPQAAGAGEHPAKDPVAAVEGDAMAVGTEKEKGLTDGEAEEPVHEREQDTAAPGQRDPDGQTAPSDEDQPDGGHVDGDGTGAGAEQRQGATGGAEIEQDGEPGDIEPAPFDIAELARSCAFAGRAFVAGRDGVTLDDAFMRAEAEIMVAFVRENPDAPLLAMYKHLELTKRLQPTTPNAEDLLALTVFHAVASAAIVYERALAAEAAPPVPAATGGWPGERAFVPRDAAFAPTGFSPR